MTVRAPLVTIKAETALTTARAAMRASRAFSQTIASEYGRAWAATLRFASSVFCAMKMSGLVGPGVAHVPRKC
jgi:hypothetical protein